MLEIFNRALVRTISSTVGRVVPAPVAEWLLTIFGLWALITPLLLWISWSAEVLAFALFTGIAAILLAGVFGIALAPDAVDSDDDTRVTKSTTTVAEVSKRLGRPTWRNTA